MTRIQAEEKIDDILVELENTHRIMLFPWDSGFWHEFYKIYDYTVVNTDVQLKATMLMLFKEMILSGDVKL